MPYLSICQPGRALWSRLGAVLAHPYTDLLVDPYRDLLVNSYRDLLVKPYRDLLVNPCKDFANKIYGAVSKTEVSGSGRPNSWGTSVSYIYILQAGC